MCPDIGMCHLSPINNKFKVHNHFPCDDMILRTYRKVNKYTLFNGFKRKITQIYVSYIMMVILQLSFSKRNWV